jgi:mono/diheme cytochrome c family protein
MDKRRTFVRLALWTALFGISTASSSDAQSPDIEKGRLAVAQACTTCHTTLGRMLQVHKQTAPQWKDTVYFMISRGAQVMPDEIDAVAAFLAQSSAAEGRGGARGPAEQTPNAPRRGGGGRGQGAGEQAPPAPTGRAN